MSDTNDQVLITLGILGKNFGSRAAIELRKNFSIVWHIDSKDQYTKQEFVDWVYIATPIEFHAEQARFFLKSKTNVILEKTPVLNPGTLDELIQVAKENNVIIYFSDLFKFRKDINSNLPNVKNITWIKSNVTDEWVATRLGFHYLYLLAELYEKLDINIININKNDLDLILETGVKKIKLSCHQSGDTNMHKLDDFVVEPDQKGNLNQMVANIFHADKAVEINHKVMRRALTLLSTIRAQMPNVNVVGAGIFGSQTAIQLAKNGYKVQLYEKSSSVMSAASAINQYRVHRGYHYPRSSETAKECKGNADLFCRLFKEAICEAHESFYSIASDNSLTSEYSYLEFLEKNELEYSIIPKMKNCALTIKVKEVLFDPKVLKQIILTRLNSLGIEISLNTPITLDEINNSNDLWITATYAGSGEFNDQVYQFELCEKPIVKLPEKYAKKSIVIMDGPFMCMDPYADTKYHVMGNVVHAIHKTSYGDAPTIPVEFKQYIDNGIIKNPRFTKFSEFQETYDKYFDNSNEIEHLGSMYTVRTVLPKREHDDARPTMVSKVSSNHVQIFSGKIVTAIIAAQDATELIETMLE